MNIAHRSIWVTGAGGLIGNQIVRQIDATTEGWQCIGLTRRDLELTDFESVQRLFHQQRPDGIIHCAAMSRSPACQQDPAQARLQNVDVTRFLAELGADVPFVFLSTDLVFDGQKGNYVETDAVNPLSVYAETKVAAEEFVRAHPRHCIVRTSLNCGASPTGDRGMDEQLLNAWRRGTQMTLFVDEFRSPIPAAATARATWELLRAGTTGIFHVAGAERLSRWQMGERLTEMYPAFRELISRGSLGSYEGAPRAPDTSLDCGKVQARLSFALPTFSEWVQHEKKGSRD